MHRPRSPFDLPNFDAEDLLSRDQTQISNRTGVVVILVLLPLIAASVQRAAHSLTIIQAAGVLAILANILATHRDREQPVHRVWIFAIFVGAIAEGSRVYGFESLMWMFPIGIAAPFMLGRWFALAISIGGFGVFLISAINSPSGLAFRATGAFALAISFAHIFASIAERLQTRLRELAVVDSLTGAYNRHYLNVLLEDFVLRHTRKGMVSSLLLLDLDHFKQINDQFGHPAGDEVLKNFVLTLHEHVRTSDEIFRLGGEEFAVVLPETDLDGCAVVAQKLRRAVEEASLLAGRPVTVSVGGGEIQVGDTPSSWLQRCDEALYRAKDYGRNRVEFARIASPSGEPNVRRSRTSIPFFDSR